MDTTIEHFNMCQKAKDIQKSWKFKRYDVFTTCYQMPDICIVDWRFYMFANDGLSIRLDPFKTMEQLWLAFVMHDKFNKVWTHNKTWELI